MHLLKKRRTESEREKAPRDAERKPAERERESAERERERNGIVLLELARRALSFRECAWRVISVSTPTNALRGAHLAPLAPHARVTRKQHASAVA